MSDLLMTDSLQHTPIGPLDSLGVDVLEVKELPLFYLGKFAPSDTLHLTRYHSQREFASGQEGIPLPYSPRTDSGMVLILLVCFLLTSFALARNKRFLSQLMKDFLLHRERSSIFTTSTAGDLRFLLLLMVQTCILGGVCIFNYFNDLQPMLTSRIPPHFLLGSYVGICLVYLLSKWMAYSFLGWLFFDKGRRDTWIESYSTLIYYLGFVLFPFVLFLVYFDLTIQLLIVIGLLLLFSTKILMLYKWLKLFLFHLSDIFLLILYFCALEIIPCLMLYRGVMELNNYLVIKF
ncbi:MAG: DUF4271 domain-containing protein [Bacteroides sp.]